MDDHLLTRREPRLHPAPASTVGAPAAVALAAVDGRPGHGRRVVPVAAGDDAACYAAIAEHTSAIILVLDAACVIRHVGASVERVYEVAPGELVGRALRDVVVLADRPGVDDAMAELVDGTAPTVRFTCRSALLGASEVHLEMTGVERLDDPAVGGLVLHGVDITDRVEGAARLAHEATHDALTGLPNRRLLLDRLGDALADPGGPRAGVAALFVDLDGFKRINDSLGHAAGDRLLTTIAERLRRRVRPSDTVSRLGGDEFVVVSVGVGDVAAALSVARRVHDAVSEPIDLDGRRVGASCSVGIAIASSVRADVLLQQADTALCSAKEAGRNRSAVYHPEMLAGARRRLDVEQRLRAAIDEHRVVVHYQPIVDVPTGRMVAVESLVRLRAQDGTLVAPVDFLDVAEETGLVVALGSEVVRKACAQQGQWTRGACLPSHRVSVNMSPAQLRAPWLVDHVERCLDDAELPADRLCLDLTEATLMEADEGVRASLATLVDIGVRVALDDFGTGWSGLGSLRKYPITTVKIDRAFVVGLGVDARDEEVVRAIVELGHALGLTVSAEGVETEAQDRAIAGLGCDLAQGFLYAPPMAADALLLASDISPAALRVSAAAAGRPGGGSAGAPRGPGR